MKKQILKYDKIVGGTNKVPLNTGGKKDKYADTGYSAYAFGAGHLPKQKPLSVIDS